MNNKQQQLYILRVQSMALSNFFALLLFLVPSICLVCSNYNYEVNSSCLACSYSCFSCTSSSNCNQCNTASDLRSLVNQIACVCDLGYYDDRVSTVCKPCTQNIANCNDCFYNSTYTAGGGSLQYGCFGCNTGYFLTGNTCTQYVTCPAGQGPNPSTNTCQACQTGCLTCQTNTKCTQCNETANYFLINSTNTCVSCQLVGCSSCISLSQCRTCATNYILNSGLCHCVSGRYYNPYSNACQLCSMYCLTCTGPSSFECTSCDPAHFRRLIGSECQCDSYNYQENSTGPICTQVDSNLCLRGYLKVQSINQCVQICGDGWKLEYQCDDGNVINTDGCSNACQIQPGFVCSTTGFQPTECRLVADVTFSSLVVKKDQRSNNLYFQVELSPPSVIYSRYNLSKIVHFRGGLVKAESVKYQNGKLFINGSYKRNLQGKAAILQIRQDYYYSPDFPQNYETLYNTTKATFKLSSQLIYLNTTNNLLPNYYEESSYEQAQTTKKGGLAIMVIAFIVGFGSLVIKNSISLMVNINALQIAFIGLVTVNGMHPVIHALLVMRPILGYSNLELFQIKNYSKNARLASLGFVQAFQNNFNIMFFVQSAFMLATILMGLASHKKPMIKLACNFLQRQSLLFIMFNMPTVFFTVTLMVQINVIGICLAVISCGVILYQCVHLVKEGKNYFAFKQVFDMTDKGHFKKFVVGYFLARLGTCLSFSFINVEPLKSLIAGAAFQAGFILFISLFRPFYHSFNNIFMILGEIMAISFFGSIYASQAADFYEQKENRKQQSVWVMVYLTGAIAVLAFANLIYSIIIDIKEGGKKLKAFNQLIEAKNRKEAVDQI